MKNIGRVRGLLYYVVELISISLKMLNFPILLAEWPYRKPYREPLIFYPVHMI